MSFKPALGLYRSMDLEDTSPFNRKAEFISSCDSRIAFLDRFEILEWTDFRDTLEGD